MAAACASCGRENAAGRKFCTGCGAGLPLACPTCAHPLEPTDRFCRACGQSLAAAATPAPTPARPPPTPADHTRDDAERKQLTVLFASVKGATDVEAELDSEEWAAIMDTYLRILQDAVTRFDGRVDSFTGEGVMALFGAPIALEDHADRACWASLDMQASCAVHAATLSRRGLQFAVRIGLNSGEAVVGRVGENLRVDPTALGHTVGLAQRMQSLADPGQIFATGHTARLARGAFTLADLGAQVVKGSREPIAVFRLEGPASGGERPVTTSSSFIGRAVEIAQLEQALDQASQGQAQIVGVAGEAGMGKSRLCQEFCDSAVSRGIPVVRTGGVAHGKAVPWLPTLRLLRNYFRILDTDDPATARQRISDRLLSIDPDFADQLPLVFDFMEVKDPERPSPPLSSEIRIDRILALLGRLTTRRSALETLVLLIEDLHWFDPQSSAFLDRWLQMIQGSRTLVIVNFRPGVDAPWMRSSFYQRISLDPLSGDETSEMLRDALGDDPSLAPLSALLTERCGGNPFFLQEVVRAMVEEGTLSGSPGAYTLDRALDQVRVPPSVHAVLAARIDRLVLDQKMLLRTASVIGRTFAEPLLARIAAMAEPELQAGLRGLCAAEMLQPAPGLAADEYRFWHALTQEVAYGTQLASRRKRLHAEVADAFEAFDPAHLDENAAVLAWHWEQSGNREQAAKWNLRAADFLLRTDIGEALRRLEMVVALLAGVEESPAVLAMAVRTRMRMVQMRARLGRPLAESEALAAEGRELADKLGDVGLRGMMTIVAGSPRLWAGDPRGALTFYQQAAVIASDVANPDLKAAMLVAQPIGLLLVGPLSDALAASELLLEVADDNPASGFPVIGYSCLVVAWFYLSMSLTRMGRLPEAAARLDQAIALGRERGDTEMLAWSLAFTSRLAWFEGSRPDRTLAEEAVRIGHQTGNTASMVLGREGEALSYLAEGDAAKAIEACLRGLEECRTQNSGLFVEPTLLDILGQARLAHGDLPGAVAAAEEAVDVARRRGIRVIECQALLGRAQVLRCSGGPAEQVQADLDAAAVLAEAVGYTALQPLVLEERGRLLGDPEMLAEAHRLYLAMGATGRAARLETGSDGPRRG